MDGEGFDSRSQKNVLGGVLENCSYDPLTGYFRDGCCNTDISDRGIHTVCALIDDEFLSFSKKMGNDLSTPRPEYGFSGLKAGDFWCLCAMRWEEARIAGVAPRVNLKACNYKTLSFIPLEILSEYQIEIRS